MQAAPDSGVTLTDCMQGVFTGLQLGIKSLISPFPFYMGVKTKTKPKKIPKPPHYQQIINYLSSCSKEKAPSGEKMHSLSDWTPQKCTIKGYNFDLSEFRRFGRVKIKLMLNLQGDFPQLLQGLILLQHSENNLYSFILLGQHKQSNTACKKCSLLKQIE